MNTYTFTKSELEKLLFSVITSFAGEDGVYDFSRIEDNIRQVVVERAIAALDAEPHCRCGRKLEVVGWNKEDYGDISIDMPIMACPVCNATPTQLPPNERDEDWNVPLEAIYGFGETPPICPNCQQETTSYDLGYYSGLCEKCYNSASAIPFDGSVPESTDDGDNISPAAIGLQPLF